MLDDSQSKQMISQLIRSLQRVRSIHRENEPMEGQVFQSWIWELSPDCEKFMTKLSSKEQPNAQDVMNAFTWVRNRMDTGVVMLQIVAAESPLFCSLIDSPIEAITG